MHLLVVVVCLVMARLGLWQWGVGGIRDSIRNYSYGLEWWAFSLLTVVGWVKFCLDETTPQAEAARQATVPAKPAPVVPAPVVPAAVADDDPELAAWNARLAELARRDAEASS